MGFMWRYLYPWIAFKIHRTREDKPKLSIFHKMHKFWVRENIVHNCDDYHSGVVEACETMLKKRLKGHSACLGGTHIEPAPLRWR